MSDSSPFPISPNANLEQWAGTHAGTDLLRYWSYDHFPMALPVRHRYPRNRFTLLRGHLSADDKPVPVMPAEPAPWPCLDLVHTPDYLRAVRHGRLTDRAMREIGLPWSPELVQRARAAVGGTLQAARDALRVGIGVVLGGGTHHAFADHGAGYCLFNDIAVAIRWLQAAGQIERAAILDLDVHQGNGTAEIFADDATVFTFSVHGAGNWPYRKSQSDWDIALPDGTGDAEYLSSIKPALEQIFEQSHPQLVFYQAGVDPLENDRLGRLAMSHEGLRRRDRLVVEFCAAAGCPLVVTMGGGYAVPIEDSVQAHAFTVQEVLRVWSRLQQGSASF